MAEYIKRAEAMKICEEYSRHCFQNNDSYGQDLAEKIEDDIIKIPTADVVEVKHGEYVYSSTDDKWHCSECFVERPRNNGEIPYSDIYCCYKCGAKMDGGSEV